MSRNTKGTWYMLTPGGHLINSIKIPWEAGYLYALEEGFKVQDTDRHLKDGEGYELKFLEVDCQVVLGYY